MFTDIVPVESGKRYALGPAGVCPLMYRVVLTDVADRTGPQDGENEREWFVELQRFTLRLEWTTVSSGYLYTEGASVEDRTRSPGDAE